jgi:hypothetical protein
VEDERIINSNLNNHFASYLSINYNLLNLFHSISEDDKLELFKIYKGDNYKIIIRLIIRNSDNIKINTFQLIFGFLR